MIYNKQIQQMINSFQEHSPQSILNCLFCLPDEHIDLKQKKKQAIFIDQYKNHQPKISLRHTVPSHIQITPFKSQKILAKSNTKRNIISTNISNHIISPSVECTTNQKNLLQTTPSLLHKTNSLRSTNQTNFQFTPSKTTIPKISFTYNKNCEINTSIKQSIININTNFQSICELDIPPKISLINKHSTSSNLSPSQEIVIPQLSQHVSNSTSPLNKIFRASNKEILVSRQLKKKSSNSFQGSGRLKRLSSLGQTFGKQRLRIRQTESIREPQDQSDLFSIVLSNNSMMNSNNNLGFLIPIDENQFQTKLSSYKD